MKNAWTERIEKLEAEKAGLLEACKALRDAVIADDLTAVVEALFIAEAAITKAAGGE